MYLFRVVTKSLALTLCVFCIILSSCGGPLPGAASVEFVFDTGSTFRADAATLTPDLPFDIVTYSIRGSGPDVGSGPLEFEIITDDNRYVAEALVFGTWEIEVSGLNATGEILAKGLTLVDIASAGIVTVELEPVEGNGSLSISVEATRLPPDSSLIAVAKDSDGGEFPLDAVTSEAGFLVSHELPSGSYLVEFSMRDSVGEELSGAVEAIYILAGFETSGIVRIAILPAPDGDVAFEIVSGGSIPAAAVLIVESGSPLFTGDDLRARFDFAQGPATRVSWYINGRETEPLSDTGDTFRTSFDVPGLYRIDALLSIDGRVSASDSAIVEIIEPYLYGPYAYVTTLRDNEDRVDGISGARDLDVHPSGSALYVAGKSESSIGYFRIDEASLEPIFISEYAASSLQDVVGLSINSGGSVLAAAGSKLDLVTLIELDDDEPEDMVVVDPTDMLGTPVLGVVDVAFAPDDRLYVLASESNMLLEFSIDVLNPTLVATLNHSDIASAAISEPISVIVSPNGVWLAISAKGSDSVTIVDTTDGLQSISITHFADGTAGVESLNGGGGMAFSSSSDKLFAVAYYDDAISRFDLGPNGWTYTGSVQNDDPGNFGFHYPRDIAIASDGGYLAVASSGDDSVAMFSLENTSPEFLDAAIDNVGRVTGLDGARSISMHPTGRAIYVASSNDSSVATFVAR